MEEIELKFLVDETAMPALRRRLETLVDGGATALQTRTLRSVYYDTPDQALRLDGVALRLRHDGEGWVQTLKVSARNFGGLQCVREIDAPCPDGKLNPDAIPDPDLRARIGTLHREDRLSPVFETVIARSAALLDTGGAVVEVALDAGEIRAGARAQPFQECELELKDGTPEALYTVAAQLFPEGGLTFSHLSKAARGFLLASDGRVTDPLAPRNAREVPLDPKQSSDTAAQAVLRECFDQIARNAEVVRAIDDPEGPHQLRIGLRRLRSALAVFRPVLGGAEAARLNAEARWLGQQVGALRDLDVAGADLLAPEAALHPDEPGFAALSRALQARTVTQRADLRATLVSARCHAFLLNLARFIETRSWADDDDADRAAAGARPVKQLAHEAMARRWAHTRKRAQRIETLDHDGRHALRKELKKLRYALEFFAPLLRPKRKARFLKRLKKLQTIFGDLNDLAMANALFLAPGAPGAEDPGAQRALGRLLGARAVRADLAWHEARALWHDLGRVKPCW